MPNGLRTVTPEFPIKIHRYYDWYLVHLYRSRNLLESVIWLLNVNLKSPQASSMACYWANLQFFFANHCQPLFACHHATLRFLRRHPHSKIHLPQRSSVLRYTRSTLWYNRFSSVTLHHVLHSTFESKSESSSQSFTVLLICNYRKILKWSRVL